MSEHTPGPWRVAQEVDGMPSGRLTRVFDSNGKQIASTFNQTRAHLQHPFDTAEANASLIAAAPDLLAACKALVLNTPCAQRPIDMTKEWLDAEDAVAKATGRSLDE